MELTSGEILFKANDIGNIGRSLCTEISDDFWQFLDTSRQNASTAEEMSHTGRAISTTVETYIMKLRHRILTIRKSIELTKVHILNELSFENEKFTSQLLEKQKSFDCEVLQLVIQYYAIIQHEISASRSKLTIEMTEKNLQFKQAAVLRDIRLFACHLMVESRGKLSFTMLPPDSQQFARCVKAVMDNVNFERFDVFDSSGRSRLSNGSGGTKDIRSLIKVLNVFKLQNSFLSGKLQVFSTVRLLFTTVV